MPRRRAFLKMREEMERVDSVRRAEDAERKLERLASSQKEREREQEEASRAERASRERLQAQIRSMPRGQILALADRAQGENGRFAKGDVGVGRFDDASFVEILWPNRTRTRTMWPNASWYGGHPITSEESALSHAEGWRALGGGLSDTSTTCGDGLSSVADTDMYEIIDFLEEQDNCAPCGGASIDVHPSQNEGRVQDQQESGWPVARSVGT